MKFLDFIFPKKCVNCRKFGDFVCDECFAKISYNQNFQCPSCLRPAVNGLTHPFCSRPYLIDGSISAVLYNGVVKKLIYQFKYSPNLSKLSKIIGEIMCEGLSQNESFYSFIEKNDPVLIPIPLNDKKLRSRGYNHAELLASYVAQYFNLSLSLDLLVRVKDTKPQFKLNKEERIKNLANAFAVSKNAQIPRSAILIDDIATSFATLKEASKVLKRSGVKKVLGVTFAREL